MFRKATLVMVLILFGLTWAEGQVTVPNSFNSGDTVSSSKINANFQALVTAINSLQATVNSHSSTIAAIQGALTKTAVMSDIQPSGTAPGISTNTYVGRTLNTLSDPDSIVGNPGNFTGSGGSNKQFTLSAGTYLVRGVANWIANNETLVSRLYNVTSSTTLIQGASTVPISGGVLGSSAVSLVEGIIVLTATSTLEFQDADSLSTATAARGVELTSSTYGNNVYTTLVVTKLK